MRQLNWSGQDDYLKAEKTVWKINSVPVGYVRQVAKFQQVLREKMTNSNVSY